MKRKNRHIFIKIAGVLFLDVATVWMMLALCGIQAAFFPWCESYLFLSAGLVNISVWFYPGLSRDIGQSRARTLIIASGILWGFTVLATLFALFYPSEFFYHTVELLGIALYIAYGMIVLFHGNQKRHESVGKRKWNRPVAFPNHKGLDSACLMLNVGENMMKSRPFLSAEEYKTLESAYWNAAENVKDVSQIDWIEDPNLLEIER